MVKSISIAGLIICAAGCAPRFSFVGHWVGRRAVTVRPGTPSDVKTSIEEVKVNIQDTGRFDLLDLGLDYSGQVSYDGDVAVLTPEQVEGISVERQPEAAKQQIPTMRLTPNRADDTLTATETKGDTKPVVLKRQQG